MVPQRPGTSLPKIPLPGGRAINREGLVILVILEVCFYWTVTLVPPFSLSLSIPLQASSFLHHRLPAKDTLYPYRPKRCRLLGETSRLLDKKSFLLKCDCFSYLTQQPTMNSGCLASRNAVHDNLRTTGPVARLSCAQRRKLCLCSLILSHPHMPLLSAGVSLKSLRGK